MLTGCSDEDEVGLRAMVPKIRHFLIYILCLFVERERDRSLFKKVKAYQSRIQQFHKQNPLCLRGPIKDAVSLSGHVATVWL